MDNKRKHTRITIERAAEVMLSGKIFSAVTINISFYGVMIRISDDIGLKPGDQCRLSLVLQEGERIAIEFECRVIHCQEAIVGLQFISISGLEGYELFKNLMVYNSPDPERLLKELEEDPGITP